MITALLWNIYKMKLGFSVIAIMGKYSYCYGKTSFFPSPKCPRYKTKAYRQHTNAYVWGGSCLVHSSRMFNRSSSLNIAVGTSCICLYRKYLALYRSASNSMPFLYQRSWFHPRWWQALFQRSLVRKLPLACIWRLGICVFCSSDRDLQSYHCAKTNQLICIIIITIFTILG